VDKAKIVCIVGPTGVGKSALSVELAKKYNAEIISCDSMQVYQNMDIGTAKITKQEMEGVPHYLLSEQSYEQPYNVKIFQEKCRAYIDKILAKNKNVILCGGTGLYLKSVLYDYTFEEQKEDEGYRAFLETKTNEELTAMLEGIDPKALEKIHLNNRKRLIRALMIAAGGKTKSEQEDAQSHTMIYDAYLIGLDCNRDLLHERIDVRVDKMFEQGLVQEVQQLFSDPATWSYTSFMGIGYKEFKPYFLGEQSLDEVKEKIKVHTRQYAKRQYTWFKNQMPVHWYTYEQKEAIEKDLEEWYES
jgi:tRNA dimethylallyltransferase